MRVGTVAIIGLLGVGTALAVNPRPATETASPQVRNDANRYATLLVHFVNAVRQQYVRDVSQADLLMAAVGGLYDAAREPLPPGIRKEIEHTNVEELVAQLIRLSDQLGEPLPDGLIERIEQASTSELTAILARLRAQLGDRESLHETRDLTASITALARALDPHCGLILRDTDVIVNENGRGYGSGVEFANASMPVPELTELNGRIRVEKPKATAPSAAKLPGALAVKSVVPGSPAHRAGLRPGDLVQKIDNRACNTISLSQFHHIFYPKYYSPDEAPFDARPVRPHTLEFSRPGFDQPRSTTLNAGSFSAETVFGYARRPDGSWSHLIDPQRKLGYARVGSINMESHVQFQAAIRELQADGCAGLILDLRWCPGGYLIPARAIARCLLDEDLPIARAIYRRKQDSFDEEDPRVEHFLDLPILVLINGETSGGGELIAAALQDHRRAAIAGDRTIGKASVQKSLHPNPLPMQFKISAGVFVRPSGKNLQRFPNSKSSDDWGVQPDPGRRIPISPALSQQLKEWWTWQTLRPAVSRESLPTDDPEADPQLQAALQMLRGMLEKGKS